MTTRLAKCRYLNFIGIGWKTVPKFILCIYKLLHWEGSNTDFNWSHKDKNFSQTFFSAFIGNNLWTWLSPIQRHVSSVGPYMYQLAHCLLASPPALWIWLAGSDLILVRKSASENLIDWDVKCCYLTLCVFTLGSRVEDGGSRCFASWSHFICHFFLRPQMQQKNNAGLFFVTIYQFQLILFSVNKWRGWISVSGPLQHYAATHTVKSHAINRCTVGYQGHMFAAQSITCFRFGNMV